MPPLRRFQTMSGRPRTTSFADGGKAGNSAPFGGMKTISKSEVKCLREKSGSCSIETMFGDAEWC